MIVRRQGDFRSPCTALFLVAVFLLLSCRPAARPLGVFGPSRLHEVLGQDGVTPIPFNEGLYLWTFGDTILGSWKGGVSTSATFSEAANIRDMLSNSLAFTEPPNPENVSSLRFRFYKEQGRVSQFLKLKWGERPEYDRLWAVDGIRLGDRVYVYYLIIKIAKTGKPLNFSMRAVGIARWKPSPSWREGARVDFERLPDLFPGNYPAFGSCVIEREGYLYTVGHYTAPDFSSPVKIARVKSADIERSVCYEFLSRDGGWVKDIARAQAFLGDVMGECSLSYNEFLQSYVMVYCQVRTGNIVMVRFRDFGGLLRARKEIVYEPPRLLWKKGEAESWYYSGKEIISSGRLLYAIYINPREYQPYLIELRL